jgi:hypothetical protein
VVVVPVPLTFPPTSHSYDLALPFATYKVQVQPPPRAVPRQSTGGDSAASDAAPSDAAADGDSKDSTQDSQPSIQYVIEDPRDTGAALCAAYHPTQDHSGHHVFLTVTGDGFNAIHEVVFPVIEPSPPSANVR